jgi:predicted alpha/beta hydrolase family esterase
VRILQQVQNPFLFVHGSNDPYCNPAEAKRLAAALAGEYIEIPGGQHFSTSIDLNFTQFPQLLQILDARHYV